jgi:hypothetical protein
VENPALAAERADAWVVVAADVAGLFREGWLARDWDWADGVRCSVGGFFGLDEGKFRWIGWYDLGVCLRCVGGHDVGLERFLWKER